jgi:hypothetical protein
MRRGVYRRLDARERHGLQSTARYAAWQVFRHAVARYRCDRVPKCRICRAASQDCGINSTLELVRIRDWDYDGVNEMVLADIKMRPATLPAENHPARQPRRRPRLVAQAPASSNVQCAQPCISRESGLGNLYDTPSSPETPVHARVFVYVPDRCGSFDCLRSLDHSCPRRCGDHTAIERIPSDRGSMNCRLTPGA